MDAKCSRCDAEEDFENMEHAALHGGRTSTNFVGRGTKEHPEGIAELSVGMVCPNCVQPGE
jgi:hypothetical protein